MQKILLVEDDEAALFGYKRSLTQSGYHITDATSLHDAKQCIIGDDFDAILLDLNLPDGNALDWIPEIKAGLPDVPVLVITGISDVPTAVRAMKSGAENFLTKPVELENLETCLKKALENGGLRKQDRIRKRLAKTEEPFFGTSPASQSLLDHMTIAASGDTIVLIQGETGTGKGVVARWIHEHGNRRSEAFVDLNCSCLKGDLLRSELFGHTKGSFTSAVSDREGLVEVADKGTLFLDEIGDMNLEVQTQFLKTIEEKTYRRIGDNRLRKSNFRLICATNKNLIEETEKGSFRKDLYYRICVLPLTLPPLRNRPEDIPALAMHLLQELGCAAPKLPSEVKDILTSYSWPGNVREMRNMLERALLLSRGAPLSEKCFPSLETPLVKEQESALPGSLQEAQREYLKKIIDSFNGDKNKASAFLGISLATLYRKLGTSR